VTYDFSTNKLIYRATVPEDYSGKIYEVGLYSTEFDPSPAGGGSKMITTFNSATEAWVDPANGTTAAAFTSANTRVGTDSLLLDPTASTTVTEARRGLSLDLSGNSAADSFVFGFWVGTAFTSSVVVRFMTDASNYYTFNLTPVTSAGYKLIDIQKGSAAATGSPNWATITELQISATSGAGGNSSVEFDAIRVEDRDADNLDYVLVARKLLTTPITKVEGQAMDIEFTLDVAV
jgi:hypothetical protein